MDGVLAVLTGAGIILAALNYFKTKQTKADERLTNLKRDIKEQQQVTKKEQEDYESVKKRFTDFVNSNRRDNKK